MNIQLTNDASISEIHEMCKNYKHIINTVCLNEVSKVEKEYMKPNNLREKVMHDLTTLPEQILQLNTEIFLKNQQKEQCVLTEDEDIVEAELDDLYIRLEYLRQCFDASKSLSELLRGGAK